MTWDGNGTYSRTNGTNTGATLWNADAAAGTKITTARHDTHDEDIATAITACLTKNMETKPTADFVPNTTTTYDLGTTSLKWEDLHLNGNALIGGTLGVTGVLTARSNIVDGSVLATETATTSGTTHDYTSIPSWVKKITVVFDVVSHDGNEEMIMQVGDAGGFHTSSYTGSSAQMASTAVATASETGGFALSYNSVPGGTYSGIGTMIKVDSAGTKWIWSCVMSYGNSIDVSAGRVTLDTILTQVRFTSTGTPDTFDAGSFNILYE